MSEDAYDSDVFEEDATNHSKRSCSDTNCLIPNSDDAGAGRRLLPGLSDICHSPQTKGNRLQPAERLQDVDSSKVEEASQTCDEVGLCRLAKSPALRDEQDEESAQLSQFQRNHHSSKSDTYTVMEQAVSQERESHCPRCESGTGSERCLYEALYTATLLSHEDKASALRTLSRFLITHLGSELSLHLCSMVNSAFHAGEEFSSLDRLDNSCMSCLPAIFQLLSLNYAQ